MTAVATVWLPVQEIGRAVDFYGDKLGLEVKQQEEQWAELTSDDGLTIGLNARDEESPAGDGGAVVAFRAEGGIDNAVAGLKDKGVTFTGEVSDHPWGKVATFRDPDGNDLQLFEAPGAD